MAGLEPSYFVHPNAVCESNQVGPGTRVWAFAHVLPEAIIGAACNVCDHVLVENDVVVGDRVTIKSGVQLLDGVRLEDDVYVGPNVTFTNDPFPRSKAGGKRFPPTIVRSGASIGANATVLPGLDIGSGAMVGAGAVVTRNVPARAIVVGNPAGITGYVQADGQRAAPDASKPPLPDAPGHTRLASPVRGVTIHRFPHFDDMRGSLTVGNLGSTEIPFVPQRYFLVYAVPGAEVRGEHAHRACHQFLVCTHGSCSVVVDDGFTSDEVRLDSPTLGIYLPPMTWGIQYKYTHDAVMLVFASHAYDPGDYIRDYPTFVEAARRT